MGSCVRDFAPGPVVFGRAARRYVPGNASEQQKTGPLLTPHDGGSVAFGPVWYFVKEAQGVLNVNDQRVLRHDIGSLRLERAFVQI